MQRKRGGDAALLESGQGPDGSPRLGARREELVLSAARIFAEKGYHATSVQDIASELGILKGSIYYYIASKEDLLFDIVRQRLDAVEQLLASLRTPRLDPLAKLRGFVEGTVTQVHAEPVQAAVCVRDLGALTGDRLAWAVKVMDRQDRFLRQQVTSGQKLGVICPDVEPAIVAAAVLGMVARPPLRPAKPRRGKVTPVTSEAFADFVLAGIACTPGRHTDGHRRRIGALPSGW